MLVRRGALSRLVLGVAALSALGLPAADAARRTTQTDRGREARALTLGPATVQARWREGWLRPGAAVRFTGTLAAAATLTATLRPLGRPGVVTAHAAFDIASPGSFAQRLRLPPRALPGRYRLLVTGTSDARELRAASVVVVIPAPPEGVLDQAEVGTSPNGPWHLYRAGSPPVLKGGHKQLWMEFRFLYPPTGKQIELVWKLHWHRVVGKVYKRYKDTLETFVNSATPLPSGHWSAVLKIDGRVAKKMDVIIS